jgi:hypothetical protein
LPVIRMSDGALRYRASGIVGGHQETSFIGHLPV